MKPKNPFVITGYSTKEYFCGRDEELLVLLRNVTNGVNTTILSPRRMGKTGLILRFFEHIAESNIPIKSIYVDIYASQSLADFTKNLAESVLKQYSEETNIGKKFLEMIKKFRPLISFDSITGDPQIQIGYQTITECEDTLESILQYLDSQGDDIVIAIDEFQQILQFPEQNVEALLRTYIQRLKHIRFIFCGSNQSLMNEMFTSAKRPFFSSTQYLSLKFIDPIQYSEFIKNKFTQHNISIADDAIQFILNWTKTHTYYTQCLCNMVFSIVESEVSITMVKKACAIILKQNESVYLQYRQLVTPAQWNFMIALAKSEEVIQITAQDFIAKFKIGTPANASRIANSLLEKELVYVQQYKTTQAYRVYDVFLLRWLQMEY